MQRLRAELISRVWVFVWERMKPGLGKIVRKNLAVGITSRATKSKSGCYSNSKSNRFKNGGASGIEIETLRLGWLLVLLLLLLPINSALLARRERSIAVRILL
jgi:hypothetical protein